MADSTIKCPECQSENPIAAVYCMECGCKIKVEEDDKYKKVQYLAVTGIFLFLPLAIIAGLYLYTRPQCTFKRKGMDIILISIVVWVFYVVIAWYASLALHQ